MAPNSTPVNRFIFTGKRCLKVFRSLRVKKDKNETVVASEEESSPRLTMRRETFFFSSTSLDKRRPSDSSSVDTIITLLDDLCTAENLYNETLEHNRGVLIEGLV